MDHSAPYPAGYIESILKEVRRIGVVGASPDPRRPSNQVTEFLVRTGYEVVPINPRPGLSEIHGQRVVASLADLDTPVDMVDVFRRSEALQGIAVEADAAGARVLWSQLGVFDASAAAYAEHRGMRVVMDRCPKIELERMARD